ncbi:MAG: zinc-binding dehydrogenase [Firmicutes bacterium]|nr:zinc-binding dehydrogenase [Bacillota bacterium]
MTNKMKAIVMYGANDFVYEETEIPKPGRKEVLIKIQAISICGSDPKIFKGDYLSINWPPRFPFTPGHEFSGKVVELGEGVTEFQIGDRVAGEAHCGCGTCENCRKGMYNLCLNYGKSASGHRHYGFTARGAYAEFNAYNVKAITKIPDGITYEEASLADTAGTALQAIRLTGIVPGGITLIIGPGPVGIFVMEIAKAMGSKTIMVGRRARLELAGELGADFLINYEKEKDIISKVKELTKGIGVDQAFECAGADAAMQQCILSTKKNGEVAFVALPVDDNHPIPVKTMVMNQIHLYGSRANPNCTKDVLELMADRRIDAKSLITHVLPLEQFHEAMDIFVNRRDGAMKVVVKPHI